MAFATIDVTKGISGVTPIANGANSAEGKGVSCVLDLAVSDYIEVYAYYQDNGGGTGSITGNTDFDTFFRGYKLIG